MIPPASDLSTLPFDVPACLGTGTDAALDAVVAKWDGHALTLSLLKKRGDTSIKSATFFTTLVDFTDPGELGVFIDEAQLAALDRAEAEPVAGL